MSEKEKEKHNQQPAWWQFPRPFYYRLEVDYETIIQVLKSLEYHKPGQEVNLTLYPSHQMHETLFEFCYRVHGKNSWEAQAQIKGHVREEAQAVIVEGILMTPAESRNTIIVFVVLCIIFPLMGSFVNLAIFGMGLFMAVALGAVSAFAMKKSRDYLLDHISKGLRAININALEDNSLVQDNNPISSSRQASHGSSQL